MHEAPPPASDQLDPTAAAWLRSWIADQLRSGAGRRADLTGVRGPAMYVYGSIGVDVALTSLGEIWVGEPPAPRNRGQPAVDTGPGMIKVDSP